MHPCDAHVWKSTYDIAMHMKRHAGTWVLHQHPTSRLSFIAAEQLTHCYKDCMLGRDVEHTSKRSSRTSKVTTLSSTAVSRVSSLWLYPDTVMRKPVVVFDTPYRSPGHINIWP